MTILTPGLINGAHQLLNKSGILNINPEFWHTVAMTTSDYAERTDFIVKSLREALYFEDPRLEVQVGNMTFKNPVGLSAGFVKKPHGLKLWEAFGFGYITIGGITVNPQAGNLKPRIFKFPEFDSIVNAVGLPGEGVDAEVKRLEIRKQLGMMPEVPLIVNLHNGVKTPEDQKIDEFKLLMEKFYPYVDGFEINVSCPNQGGVCDMQQEGKIKKLLTELQEHNKLLATRFGIERKTMLVKIAPLSKNEFENNGKPIKDLTLDGLELIANVCNDVGIDGVTATNTSAEHNLGTRIQRPDGQIIGGGLSGLGLHEQSLRTVRELRRMLDKTIPIIGVGGIGYDNEKDFEFNRLSSGTKMMQNGASSIEILSSFIQKSVVTPYNLKKSILEQREFRKFLNEWDD